MAKRIRLLIIDADPVTHEFQRERDYFKTGTTLMPRSGRNREDVRWTSIELDPLRITLLQVLRVLWREARKPKS